MKLKEFLKQFEGLDFETEILVGGPDDYEEYLKPEMKIVDVDLQGLHYNVMYTDMSSDFENGNCTKVIFLA